MKRCYKCGQTKLKTEFNKNKNRKDGLKDECRVCTKAYAAANKEKAAENMEKWRKENREWDLAYKSAHKKANRHKYNAYNARRRVAKLQAMLKYGKEHLKKDIEVWYRRAKLATLFMEEEYHVDHIEPLQGIDVCGLHVPWNLQLLTAKENISKGNRRHKVNAKPK